MSNTGETSNPSAGEPLQERVEELIEAYGAVVVQAALDRTVVDRVRSDTEQNRRLNGMSIQKGGPRNVSRDVINRIADGKDPSAWPMPE